MKPQQWPRASSSQEAEIELAGARIAWIDRQREKLRGRMAERQEPVVRLTAALQMMARRPLVFSLVRAESLRDTVYLRRGDGNHAARSAAAAPPVCAPKSSAGRKLQEDARLATVERQASETVLKQRQTELAALESRQRLESRAAQGVASREADRGDGSGRTGARFVCADGAA